MRMLRTRVVGGVLVTIFSTLARSQDATPPDPYPYFSVLPGYVFADREFASDDHGLSATALFGKPLTPHLSLEVNASGAVLESGRDGDTDFYQKTLAADLVFNFLDVRNSSWRPFLLLGVGAVQDDFFPNERDGTGWLFEGGLGVATRPLLWNTIALRFDARYLHDRREGGNGETRVSLGFEFPLGRVERVVEYVQVEKIIEKEIVREVPVERRSVDSDGDTVEDSRDRCPDTPRGLKVDANGCAIVNQAIELRGVTFELGKSRLTPNAQTVLDGVSRAFIGQSGLRVEIAGHTDSTGSDAANLKLSQQRADAVRTYLIFKGASESQLTAKGYGESQLLISPEKTAEDRERNRRVELRVIDGR